MFEHYSESPKSIALALLSQYDLSCFSKELLRSICQYLELEESKAYQKYQMAERITQIYESSRGQYDKYLMQPKLKVYGSQAKDFLWSVFKQFDQRMRERRHAGQSQSARGQMGWNPMAQNQNMNMSMVNMFMDVPNFQTVDEIEIFQRKMYEIYKNFLPQVLSSMPSVQVQAQGQFFRQNSYQPYAMSKMQNNSGLMGANLSLNTMRSFANSMGMSQPRNQMPIGYSQNAFQSAMPYVNKFMYESQVPTRPMAEKNLHSQFRPVSPAANPLGFSYYGERIQQGNQDYGQGIRGPASSFTYNKMHSGEDLFGQKQPYSQKNVGNQGLREDNYYAPFHQLSMGLERCQAKVAQKDRQPLFHSSPQLPIGHEPRKMHKKDDEVSIFGDHQVLSDKKDGIVACNCSKSDEKMCNYCKIVNLDPLNEVEQVVKIELISPGKTEVKCTIPQKILRKLSQDVEKLDIEIRCIQADKSGDTQICWPEKSRFSIDEEIIDEISTVNNTKKRRERPFIMSKYFGTEKNTQDSIQVLLEINKNDDASAKYVFGVFVVSKNTVKCLYDRLLPSLKPSPITELFAQDTSLKQIAISPVEPNTHKPIREPVRGAKCKHAQCFDLQIYLSLLMVSPIRQWRCPICGAEAKKFVADPQIKAVLGFVTKMIQLPSQIVFCANGGYKIVHQKQEPKAVVPADQGKQQQQDQGKAEQLQKQH